MPIAVEFVRVMVKTFDCHRDLKPRYSMTATVTDRTLWDKFIDQGINHGSN